MTNALLGMTFVAPLGQSNADPAHTAVVYHEGRPFESGTKAMHDAHSVLIPGSQQHARP
jgi:hypothetical protein